MIYDKLLSLLYFQMVEIIKTHHLKQLPSVKHLVHGKKVAALAKD